VTDVVFYFQVHQPYRLERYTFFDVGTDKRRFDDKENRRIVERVAERCYLPMNALVQDLIERTGGRFRCSYSISGTVLRQLEEWVPEALDSFVALSRTGNVEFLCETAYHSLASVGDPAEFAAQVELQRQRIEQLFGKSPTTFRNTELVFDNEIAKRVEDLGFQALLGEGADHLLEGRSPRRVYGVRGCSKLRLLLRDYPFSDDIAFRFSNREWPQYPLMADTFADWLHKAVVPEDAFIGLFMDYETFGEHQGEGTGILEFMKHLPGHVLEDPRFGFATPSQVAAAHEPADRLDVPRPVSWADQERDLSAWLSNHMQQAAHRALYALGRDARRSAALGQAPLLEEWRRLTTSDHVYYMCTKFRSDGDVHEYFTPYESPHDSYILFMNVLDDLSGRIRTVLEGRDVVAPAVPRRDANRPADADSRSQAEVE